MNSEAEAFPLPLCPILVLASFWVVAIAFLEGASVCCSCFGCCFSLGFSCCRIFCCCCCCFFCTSLGPTCGDGGGCRFFSLLLVRRHACYLSPSLYLFSVTVRGLLNCYFHCLCWHRHCCYCFHRCRRWVALRFASHAFDMCPRPHITNSRACAPPRRPASFYSGTSECWELPQNSGKSRIHYSGNAGLACNSSDIFHLAILGKEGPPTHTVLANIHRNTMYCNLCLSGAPMYPVCTWTGLVVSTLLASFLASCLVTRRISHSAIFRLLRASSIVSLLPQSIVNSLRQRSSGRLFMCLQHSMPHE